MINWLEKLGLGLKKSSQKIGGGISGIFTKGSLTRKRWRSWRNF